MRPLPAALRQALVGVVAGVVLALLAACATPPDDETAVRDRIGQLEQAIEDRDAADLEALLAEDFSGPGGMDRPRARAMASLLMARHRDVTMAWTLDGVDIQGDRARVDLSVALSSGTSPVAFPSRARLLDVELGLRRDGGRWMVVAARWSDKFDR